jgi:Mg-chelatase subunit ChlD
MLATLVRRGATLALIGVTASPVLAQTVVSGTVRDDRNAPLSGAAISIRGSHVSVMSSERGSYRLVIPPGTGESDSLTVLARRIGFEAITRRIPVGSSTIVDFALRPAMLKLEGVVVTGTNAAGESDVRSSAKERPRALAPLSASVSDEKRDARAGMADRAALARADASRVGGRGAPRQEPRPGVLTAAAWDDAAHWPQYMRFLKRAGDNAWNPWGLDVGQSTIRPARRDVRQRSQRRALDIGFLVDATGSMGDEMTYLQSELKDIVRRVRAIEPDLDIRLSVVFYRDRGDEFITKSLPFTRSVDEAVSFISGTSAGGGGDFPEDMNAGLEAMMRQRWSRDAVPQMLFLLADAPPQQYAGVDYTYHEAIQDAAANGIAIYPVAASGVDKPTEFLFRAMAVMTGGKYVFLTDDSGVGNSHEEPDISGYTVEKLNDLMVREIRSYVSARTGGRRVAEAR